MSSCGTGLRDVVVSVLALGSIGYACVAAFVVLGPRYTEPQDLWWIPMGMWMIVTYAVLIGGGLLIAWELKLDEDTRAIPLLTCLSEYEFALERKTSVDPDDASDDDVHQALANLPPQASYHLTPEDS